MDDKRKIWVTVTETKTKMVEVEAEDDAKAMFEAQQLYMQGKLKEQLSNGAAVKATFKCGPFATEFIQPR